MRPLGRNIGSYQGDTIRIADVLAEIKLLADRTGWEPVPLALETGLSYPAYCRNRVASRHIYISAGIHGDEPAGPLAVRVLFERNTWPDGVGLWAVPCLNPLGFDRNTRHNEDGVDLNRDYREPKSALTRAHIRWLQTLPRFDFCLCLHEDWESHGFYLYELNPERRQSLAERIIAGVKPVCPIDLSPEIEGRKAEGGIICANPDLLKRPDWPEAFHLIHHKTRLTYTLEAPSDFPIETRVNALVAGVQSALVA